MNTSTLDRERLSDLLDDKYQLVKDQFADDTRAAFAAAFAGGNTSVEWVQYAGGARVRTQPTREAVYEELDYLGPQQAFWKVVAESKCPLVAELKKAIADSYVERWAADVAELRSGE